MSHREKAAFAQPATGVKHGAALTLGNKFLEWGAGNDNVLGLKGELENPTQHYARSACQGMHQFRYGRFGFTPTTELQPRLILPASIQGITNLVLHSNHAVCSAYKGPVLA